MRHARQAALAWTVVTVAAVRPSPAQTLPDSVLRRVDRVFSGFDRTDAPGCALGIYRSGEIAYTRGYGMANLELGVPISPRTMFDIGSTSKQFTAFAVALLEQDGKLSSSDPARRYIPELGPYADAVTIADLVHHTSGLRDYLVLMTLAGYRDEDHTDAGDALRLIARQKALNFPANREWLYSNTGYFLLSVIVERVSGATLRAFAQQRIFGPLGMEATHFHDDHGMVVPHRATGYGPRQSGGYSILMSDYEQTGDGGVMTSVEEMDRWDRNFYDGELGGVDLVRRQQVPAVLEDGKATDYAGGLRIGRYRGLATVRHGGGWVGYRAELLRFPDQRTSFAVFCNRGDAAPGWLAQQVADVVLETRLGPVAAPARVSAPSDPQPSPPSGNGAAKVGDYAGAYFSEELDAIWTIEPDSTRLRVTTRGRPSLFPRPGGPDQFSDQGVTLIFSRDRKGKVSGFSVRAGRVRDLTFVRRLP
jgi:CubicO group peptidase (beta-lactamase class C family)